MLGFKEFTQYIATQYITEELTPKIYSKVKPSTLMNLSKTHGTTRFVIGKTRGDITAGNAHDFIHDDLGWDSGDIAGTITHDNGNFHYATHSKSDQHPILQTLETKGCKRGRVVGDWGKIKAVDLNDHSSDYLDDLDYDSQSNRSH